MTAADDAGRCCTWSAVTLSDGFRLPPARDSNDHQRHRSRNIPVHCCIFLSRCNGPSISQPNLEPCIVGARLCKCKLWIAQSTATTRLQPACGYLQHSIHEFDRVINIVLLYRKYRKGFLHSSRLSSLCRPRCSLSELTCILRPRTATGAPSKHPQGNNNSSTLSRCTCPAVKIKQK